MFAKTLTAAATAVALAAGGVALAQNTQRTIIAVPQDGSVKRTLGVVAAAVGDAETAPANSEVALQTRIQFKLNSAELTSTAKDQLRILSQTFNDPSVIAAKFLIEGHTDASGAAGYNRGLSERRAASVMAFLMQNGVDGSRLASTGYGEERLIPDIASNSPLNRRVEFLIRR